MGPEQGVIRGSLENEKVEWLQVQKCVYLLVLNVGSLD